MFAELGTVAGVEEYELRLVFDPDKMFDRLSDLVG